MPQIGNNYNVNGCRALASAILLSGMEAAAWGKLDAQIEAYRWLHGQDSLQWAQLLGIEAWPPTDEALERIRFEHIQKLAPASRPRHSRQIDSVRLEAMN
jgi:hypothetical protein